MAPQAMGLTAEIEDALIGQWSLFGRWPGGELHESDGLLWFENQIRHLPYNGVLRTRLGAGGEADRRIEEMVARFASRQADFMWFDHPTATPADLAQRLDRAGLRPVETLRCMWCELDQLPLTGAEAGGGAVEVLEVAGERALDQYTALTLDYWEISGPDRDRVVELHRYWHPGRVPGCRYLARLDGEPVAKGYLSLAGPPAVAAIYGMFTRPEARGRGAAGALTAALLARARAEGRRRVVLHSSEMAAGVYERAGFREHFQMEVFATAPVWSHDD